MYRNHRHVSKKSRGAVLLNEGGWGGGGKPPFCRLSDGEKEPGLHISNSLRYFSQIFTANDEIRRPLSCWASLSVTKRPEPRSATGRARVRYRAELQPPEYVVYRAEATLCGGWGRHGPVQPGVYLRSDWRRRRRGSLTVSSSVTDTDTKVNKHGGGKADRLYRRGLTGDAMTRGPLHGEWKTACIGIWREI